MSTGYLGIAPSHIGREGSALRRWWLELERRHRAVVLKPADATAKNNLSAHIDGNLPFFRAGVPPNVVSFAIRESMESRRLTFLKHILTAGYPIPIVVDNINIDALSGKVIAAMISDYFYDASINYLSAAQALPELFLTVTAPISGKNDWVIMDDKHSPPRIKIKFGLTFWGQRLSLTVFPHPLPIHYLYPLDSYFKTDRSHDLLARAERFRIPMPGSRVIRRVVDDKRLYRGIFEGLEGISFPAEEIVTSEGREPGDIDFEELFTRFAAKHHTCSIFLKPSTGFGGYGAASFELPHDLDKAAKHARHLLQHWGSFLIQQRIFPVPLSIEGEEWNVRQYALWTEKGLESRWRRFRVAKSGEAINTMQGARSLTERQLLQLVKLSEARRQRFQRTLSSIDAIGANILQRFNSYMLKGHRDEGLNYIGWGSTLCPSIISIDLMIRGTGKGGFEIFFLEINDHSSRGIANYDAIHHLERNGEGPIVFDEHSLARAMTEMMLLRGREYKRMVDKVE